LAQAAAKVSARLVVLNRSIAPVDLKASY